MYFTDVQGGFARVYEVQDVQKQRRALKVVSKASIKTKRNKTKVSVLPQGSVTKSNSLCLQNQLWAEIKLHQMLTHPNIVGFEDCFEDEANVYMILELCHNGVCTLTVLLIQMLAGQTNCKADFCQSLMDMLRKRKRFTEPEARFYLVQIIGANQYMHQTNVIHRDLKLGNIFLDDDMNLKVGDFGLAALIEKPGDRKK
jgi:serine/threonine protein kinase